MGSEGGLVFLPSSPLSLWLARAPHLEVKLPHPPGQWKGAAWPQSGESECGPWEHSSRWPCVWPWGPFVLNSGQCFLGSVITSQSKDVCAGLSRGHVMFVGWGGGGQRCVEAWSRAPQKFGVLPWKDWGVSGRLRFCEGSDSSQWTGKDLPLKLASCQFT